jgi:hypothetical protein
MTRIQADEEGFSEKERAASVENSENPSSSASIIGCIRIQKSFYHCQPDQLQSMAIAQMQTQNT